MPTSQLAPIEGDPQAVAAAGRTLDSIAAEVAIASKILRALATGTDEWTGHAASQAKLRSATLPPKLDKVERSYATAGGALRTYATALVETQQRSAAAIRAHIAANADLAAARAAKQSAAEADAAQAKAAAAAAVPAPPPTAVRYDADISDAEARAARAVQANADAHDDLKRAAHSAASSLHDASREGIKNKPWWRRVLTSTAHWASVAWHDGLRLVSRVATAVSALAGLAALTLALAGIAFPPLEAAAAILETISVVSGVVGMAADTAMAATGDGSWTTVAGDALMFAPVIGAAGIRRVAPVVRRIERIKQIDGSVQNVTVAAAPAVGRANPNRDFAKLGSNEAWADSRTLRGHFGDHGRQFGAASEDEYARLASNFFIEGQQRGLPTRVDGRGTIRMYDRASNTFGSYTAGGRTRTFFKPTSPTYWDRQPGTPFKDLMKS